MSRQSLYEEAEAAQAKAGRDARSAARRRADDLAVVMASEAGRRVIWRILQASGVLARVGEPIGLVQYQAGKQAVGVDLLNEVLALPAVEGLDAHVFVTMMNEARSPGEAVDG